MTALRKKKGGGKHFPKNTQEWLLAHNCLGFFQLPASVWQALSRVRSGEETLGQGAPIPLPPLHLRGKREEEQKAWRKIS